MENVAAEKKKPQVFDFTDYRAYLKAFYDWRKFQGAFSHRTFCERAGLKSRSYLRLVLSGKRNLTPDSISRFIMALELFGGEAEAFSALVHFNQAAEYEGRKHYWDLFSKYRPKGKKSQVVHDIYSYLTRMSYPVLLNLLRQPHVSQDPQTLSKLAGLSISQLEEAFSTLMHLGFVMKDPHGLYKVTCASFSTPDDVSNVAIPTFHKNMLKLAQEKASLPAQEREFQSVMVSLGEEEFLYIKKRLRDLAQELDERFSGTRPDSERVYAINLNLIPVTPEFIRKEAGHPQDDSTSASQKTVEVTDSLEILS